MRLALFIASLLIASAAGCGPSGGRRDPEVTERADRQTEDGAKADPAARSGRTATTDSERASAAAEHAAEAAAMTAAETSDSAARTECRKPSIDPSEVEDESTTERCKRMALLLNVDVRDLLTGAPVAGVAVGRGEHTDVRGHFEQRRPLPHPGERIEVRCPTRIDEMQGRLLGTAPITVRNGRADVVIAVEARCSEPAPHRIRRRFAGLYASGFEISDFLPCEGMPAEADYYTWPHSYWVEMRPEIWQALDRAAPPKYDPTPSIPRFPIGIRKAYVEWLATETGPGLNGHMGNGLYQLDIETLYRVSASPPASCRPSGWETFGLPPQRVDPRERPLPFQR